MLTPKPFLFYLSLLMIPIFLSVAIVPQLTSGQAQVLPTQGLRQLPQDYSITTYPPAGVPQQQNTIFGFDVNNLISMLGGSGIGGTVSTFISKFLNKKTEQEVKQTKQEVAVVKEQAVAVKQTNQEIAKNVVKLAEVNEQHLNLTYDNMPQKGNEITNKPVLKQDNIKVLKDEILKTAAKA